MKKLQVTALILAVTLGAGALTACSSKNKEESQPSVSTETTEVQEESVVADSEAEIEEETEETLDAQTDLLEEVLQHITVARVDSVKEDGSLELTLFEVKQEEAATETAVSEAEVPITEAAIANSEAVEEEAVEEETAKEENAEETVEEIAKEENTEETADQIEAGANEQLTAATAEFDFTTLDLNMFAETELKDSYEANENIVIRMVVDGVMTEAAMTAIQEGDMLVFYTDADKAAHIIIYRNALQTENVVEE